MSDIWKNATRAEASTGDTHTAPVQLAGFPRLTALFRMLFEDTVFGILRRERLECARRLLNEKGKNITEIAYLCGFSSPSHLTKAFSAQFGISPKQYQIARRHGHPAASVSCDEQHT